MNRKKHGVGSIVVCVQRSLRCNLLESRRETDTPNVIIPRAFPQLHPWITLVFLDITK